MIIVNIVGFKIINSIVIVNIGILFTKIIILVWIVISYIQNALNVAKNKINLDNFNAIFVKFNKVLILTLNLVNNV